MQLRAIDTLAPARHSARIIDALLMMCFIIRQPLPGVPGNLPVSDVAALALLFVALFRKPTRSLHAIWWWTAAAFAMIAMGVISSMINDHDFIRRAGSISILALLALAIASGRIDVWSGLKGLMIGFVANTVLFYLKVVPDTYGGVLTGLLGDKNVVGLYSAVVPFAVLAFLNKPWQRVLMLAGGFAGAWLADSRTSMAALAIAIVFFVAGRFLGTFFRLGLGGMLVWLFFWVEANFSHAGEYVDRLGSDALRNRIDTAMIIKANLTPWYGQGLGESTVIVESKQWFFHNSFYAFFVEGGWIMLVAGLAVFVSVALMPFPASGHGPANARSDVRLGIQAGTLALMLCATRLGETFLTIPAFLLVGVGLALICDRFDAHKAEIISKKAASAKGSLERELEHRRILEERAERARMEERARATALPVPAMASPAPATSAPSLAEARPTVGATATIAAPVARAVPDASPVAAPMSAVPAPVSAPQPSPVADDAHSASSPEAVTPAAETGPAPAPGSRRARRLAEQAAAERREGTDAEPAS